MAETWDLVNSGACREIDCLAHYSAWVPKKGHVRAAGGIVWRMMGANREVLIVHRPRYDDWSFPKGKRENGESDEHCALREVEEETGLVVELGPPLITLTYVDHKGRDKTVVYWAMTVAAGCDADVFVANEEVDAMRWVSAIEAEQRLTYDDDRRLLASLPERFLVAGRSDS
jgi:8-oxo-dGTP pyrophosphatase MutT (NUDIX family)